MARILRPIFDPDPTKPIPRSDASRQAEAARVAESERLRKLLLTDRYTSEAYGPRPSYGTAPDDELMPTYDEVAHKFNGDYSIYDQMKRNNLHYASCQADVVDILMTLPLTWLPGMEGDAESEQATAEIASAWENIDERGVALAAACEGFETGFAPLENVWGVHTRGKARDLIAPVELINRPVSWYGFDWKGRPRFKGQHYTYKPEEVPEYKVTFLRSGSVHSRYGRGTGQYCYPEVWRIDTAMKRFNAMTERNSYMPVTVTYPDDMPPGRVDALERRMKEQWKNVIVVPGAVKDVVTKIATEAAYAAAGATGVSLLKVVEVGERWISNYLRGSHRASNSEGSFAREKVQEGERLYKAPTYASCIEAMLNRGFVRPIILVNRPTLDESKWPRCAIDSKAGEDLDLMLRLMEGGVKMGARISTVTFSEAFKIPLAADDDPNILSAPQPIQAAAITPEEEAIRAAKKEADPVEASARMMSEQNVIKITMDDGTIAEVFSHMPIYTKNRDWVCASFLQNGDLPVLPKSMVQN